MGERDEVGSITVTPRATAPANRMRCAAIRLIVGACLATALLTTIAGKAIAGTPVGGQIYAGYIAGECPGRVQRVLGAWIVPSINCSPKPSASGLAIWAGMDAGRSRTDLQRTIEQTGVYGHCEAGAQEWSAWVERALPPSAILVCATAFGEFGTGRGSPRVCAGCAGESSPSGGLTTVWLIPPCLPLHPRSLISRGPVITAPGRRLVPISPRR